MIDKYRYLGCPRCGEIALVASDEIIDCPSCLMIHLEVWMRDAKQLRRDALRMFKNESAIFGQGLNELASAIETADRARRLVLRNTLRAEEE